VSPAAVFGPDVEILYRTPNLFASTSQSEVVTCRLADGRTVRLMCKYAAGPKHLAFGHRSGVAYEGRVYREILGRLPVSTPVLFGRFEKPETGEPWLALEVVEDAVLADSAPDPGRSLELSAEWIGRFHYLAGDCNAEFLSRYDRDYYSQWAERTSVLAAQWHSRLPWLGDLCERALDAMASIVALPATVIHGEYTPHNILIRGNEVFPIDWESAALGLAEIDLVCLIDKWPDDIAARCIRAYAEARFLDGPPSDWNGTLDLARLYWDFRWLGDRPEWTSSEKVGPRFEHLRQAAERLGLL
jgi:Phosphotransferase enzyme family